MVGFILYIEIKKYDNRTKFKEGAACGYKVLRLYYEARKFHLVHLWYVNNLEYNHKATTTQPKTYTY